VSAECRT